MGDTANIDFDGFLNGERFDGGKAEGYSLELGSNSFVPGFEEQVVGMKIGEEKDLDITFPEEYVENLAGKAVVFKVKLNGITVDELPELDDEFAKDVSEFDTLDEYKADLRKNLQKNKRRAGGERLPFPDHEAGRRQHERGGARRHDPREGRGDRAQLRRQLRHDRPQHSHGQASADDGSGP